MDKSFALALLLVSYMALPPVCIAENASTPATDEKLEDTSRIYTWFSQYDEIRRNAEMSMSEKLRMHHFFGKGLTAFAPDSSEPSEKLITQMIARYDTAYQAMQALTEVPETKDLQCGYTKFFKQAKELFEKYLEIERNRKKVGFTEHLSLVDQKTALQNLDAKNKALDHSLRQKYSIAPHKHS